MPRGHTLTAKAVVTEAMENHLAYVRKNPILPVWLDGARSATQEAIETAAQLNECELRACQKRIDRYNETGIISSVGAW